MADSSGPEVPRPLLYRRGAIDTSQPLPPLNEWMRSLDRSSYTGARTVDRRKIFMLSQHISRLAESFDALIHRPDFSGTLSDTVQQLTVPSVLRVHVLRAVRTVLDEYQKQAGSGETKITIALCAEPVFDLQVYVCHLPPPPSDPVTCELVHVMRHDPSHKDSAWIQARERIPHRPGVHELLLTAPDGRVLEGSSSNLFVVKAGVVYTTLDDVLVGTVQRAAVQLCRQHGLPLTLAAPRRDEMSQWDEAFLASTSRWVLPIGTIYDGDRAVVLPSTTVGTRLNALVQAHAREFSESIDE